MPLLVSATLQRHDPNTPWGFRLQGGVEFNAPLTVALVHPGSLSDKCGLRPGDEIVSINNYDASCMSHIDAQDCMRTTGQSMLKMQLRRATISSPALPYTPVHNNFSSPTPTQHTDWSSPAYQPVSLNLQKQYQHDLQHAGQWGHDWSMTTQNYNNRPQPFGGRRPYAPPMAVQDTPKRMERDASFPYAPPPPLQTHQRGMSVQHLPNPPYHARSPSTSTEETTTTNDEDDDVFGQPHNPANRQEMLNKFRQRAEALSNGIDAGSTGSAPLQAHLPLIAGEAGSLHDDTAVPSSHPVHDASVEQNKQTPVDIYSLNLTKRFHRKKLDESYKNYDIAFNIDYYGQPRDIVPKTEYFGYPGYPEKVLTTLEDNSRVGMSALTPTARLVHACEGVDTRQYERELLRPASGSPNLSGHHHRHKRVKYHNYRCNICENAKRFGQYELVAPEPVNRDESWRELPAYHAVRTQPAYAHSPTMPMPAPHYQTYASPPPPSQYSSRGPPPPPSPSAKSAPMSPPPASYGAPSPRFISPPPSAASRAPPPPPMAPIKFSQDENGDGDGIQPRFGKQGDVAMRDASQFDAARVPICHDCNKTIRGPFLVALDKSWCPDHFKCSHCTNDLTSLGFIEIEGRVLCESDYAQKFAPRCDKCNNAIVGTIVYALNGTLHNDCFRCARCDKAIGGGLFHMEDGLPYCQDDWIEMFQTKCAGCDYPIEPGDKWIEAMETNWHGDCFNCSTCQCNLQSKGFVVKNGKPFCKIHARGA